MHKVFPILLTLAIAAAASAPPTAIAQTSPSTSGTPPPVIIHIITRPLCTELHKHIGPAIAMMLQNDKNIGKGPDLFSRFNRAALSGSDSSLTGGGGSSSGGSAAGIMTPSQNMVLLGMENLVSPIANNIIATQKMLDSPALTNGTGNPQDDAALQDMRAKLLKALASQNAALDLINGFLTTQQMADLQHSGQEFISAVNQSDITGKGSGATPTPNPLLTNPNQAGLPANPYSIDLANIPGLTVGYNPVTRILDGLQWTIGQTQTRENDAAKSVMSAAAQCSGPPAHATPKP